MSNGHIDIITAELTKARAKIEERDREKARLQGQLDAAIDRMSKEFGVSTVAEAHDLVDRLDDEAHVLEKEAEALLAKLKENYSW